MKKEKQIKDILKNDKNYFYGALMIFCPTLLVFLGVVFFSKNSELYKNANEGLMVVSIICFTLSFLFVFRLKTTIQNIKDAFSGKSKLGYGDYADFAFLGAFLIAIVSFLFIIDTEIIRISGGVKIGTVIALGFLSLLGNFITIIKGKWYSWKKRR